MLSLTRLPAYICTRSKMLLLRAHFAILVFCLTTNYPLYCVFTSCLSYLLQHYKTCQSLRFGAPSCSRNSGMSDLHTLARHVHCLFFSLVLTFRLFSWAYTQFEVSFVLLLSCYCFIFYVVLYKFTCIYNQ